MLRRISECAAIYSLVSESSSPLPLRAALKRALASRDQGCVFPGCVRPPVACEAHQIPSVPDGSGDLADLCLLCVAHHRLLHEGGFGVSRSADGRLPFVRPDGSPLLGPRHRLDLYGRLFGHPPHA